MSSAPPSPLRAAPEMTSQGYSDRINHALAFAAKHHDQQVRRGTRLPYFTQPANVAVILTRYGLDEATVVAGILHDVVADYVKEGYTRELLGQRIGEKFGAEVLEALLAVVERRTNDAGADLANSEQRDDLLARLPRAPERGHWVLAAVTLHGAATLLADLRRTLEASTVWNRFSGGRSGALGWYRRIHEGLQAAGFTAPIVGELGQVIDELEQVPE
ncbi:MAG TPA: HD domain-containing protein [Gemmatimonadaceae bacterium]